MSGQLAVVDSSEHLIEEVLPEPVPGRLARMVAKVREVKARGRTFLESIHLLGLGGGAWLVGYFGSIVVLSQYVSPVITELAMTTLIVPVAALGLVILGEFDFTKLTTMIASNAGIVFAIGGAIIIALFVQNVVKTALLTKSFTSESHKQYRTYALASMLTPITTSLIWYVADKTFGFFLGAKSIIIGVLASFASSAIGEAVKNVDPMNIATADIASVANATSLGLRLGLGFLIVVHLTFVFISYGQVHKGLNYLFDRIAQGIFSEEKRPKLFVEKRDPQTGDMVNEVTGWGCASIILILVAVSSLVVYVLSPSAEARKAEIAQEAVEKKLERERAWRVACIDGVTYGTEAGQAYRLTNADGSSHCTVPLTEKNLRLGDEFSEGKSYRRDVIELDAGGYDKACLDPNTHSDRIDLNDNCRIDNTARRNVRYWLELPEGLPKGVKMPALPAPKAPAG